MARCWGVLVWCLACVVVDRAVGLQAPSQVIDLRRASLDEQVAALACVGLRNRGSKSAYAVLKDLDLTWLDRIGTDLATLHITNDTKGFVDACMQDGTAKGYIAYDPTLDAHAMPLVITLAGVLDGIPLPTKNVTRFSSLNDAPYSTAKLLINATTSLLGLNDAQATEWVYSRFVNETTALAFMNPGYDTGKLGNLFNPPLTGSIKPGLIDFIVKERIFNFYLVNACTDLFKKDEKALMEKMAANNPWPSPIPVYGYNDAYDVAGYLFEAETNCIDKHNMGEIATKDVSNLAYFSRSEAISDPVESVQPRKVTFNSSKVYLGLIIGDGDNIRYMKESRSEWMLKRSNYCAGQPDKCFDLMWTVSPQLMKLAPDVFKWYQKQALSLGHDYFILPPSGDLYSYPGMFQEDDKKRYVENTERDCTIMSTNGLVDWQYAFTWKTAFKEYFPRYVDHGICTAFFGVNDPFLVPIWAFKSGEFFKVLGEKVVVFHSHEWRGAEGHGHIPFTEEWFLTAENFAREINNYPSGTVASIYLTSDGGGKIEDFFQLVENLGEHVQVLSSGPLVEMALASAAAKQASEDEQVKAMQE